MRLLTGDALHHVLEILSEERRCADVLVCHLADERVVYLVADGGDNGGLHPDDSLCEVGVPEHLLDAGTAATDEADDIESGSVECLESADEVGYACEGRAVVVELYILLGGLDACTEVLVGDTCLGEEECHTWTALAFIEYGFQEAVHVSVATAGFQLLEFKGTFFGIVHLFLLLTKEVGDTELDLDLSIVIKGFLNSSADLHHIAFVHLEAERCRHNGGELVGGVL